MASYERMIIAFADPRTGKLSGPVTMGVGTTPELDKLRGRIKKLAPKMVPGKKVIVLSKEISIRDGMSFMATLDRVRREMWPGLRK
ncbi:MAG: hypothetical protein KGH94_04945 [Candidatus Micrarchaeota archaeon]|nr:hypothetical protein [Candidatus Micrarchaeota archaeon]